MIGLSPTDPGEIATADLETAEASSDHAVFREGAWGLLSFRRSLGLGGASSGRRSWSKRTADPGEREVGRVLTGNGITRYGDGLYSLTGAEELSGSERDALLQLCRQRLDGFHEQRGEEVFANRSRHRSPISGSVKGRIAIRHQGSALTTCSNC